MKNNDKIEYDAAKKHGPTESRNNNVCVLRTHAMILNYWWLYGITSEIIYVIDVVTELFPTLI